MRKGLSQEGLKLIACITMLIDHIGYEIIYPLYAAAAATGGVDFPGIGILGAAGKLYVAYLCCRMIGRISFPIFAFLLAEGAHRTRSRKKYALRLAVGAALSEIPYNLMVSGRVFCSEQSVMVTLLLGFCAVLAMERCKTIGWKPVVVIPFALLAEVLSADYGWGGVALIAMFDFSRYLQPRNLLRFFGMLILFHYMPGMVFMVGNAAFPMQILGVLSLLFIGIYDGRKVTAGKGAQWAFYLFYPVHMLVLWLIRSILI